MYATTLRAHFDGDKIVLDDPFELKPDTRLIVTVLPSEQPDEERDDWGRLALLALQSAYGEDEPEYSLDSIKELNPEYERK